MQSLSTPLFKTRGSWRGEVEVISMLTLRTRTIKINIRKTFLLRQKEAMALMAFMEEVAELSSLTVNLDHQSGVSMRLAALLTTHCLI